MQNFLHAPLGAHLVLLWDLSYQWQTAVANCQFGPQITKCEKSSKEITFQQILDENYILLLALPFSEVGPFGN